MKLATIEQILSLSPIDGADRIELATVLGWQVVVKKGEFNVGDLCIYIPIDTTVDPQKEYFKHLANQKNPEKRVKIQTIKLKGVYSQGFILPISILKDIQLSIGDDVSVFLDVQKYEKENLLISNGTTTHNKPFPTEIISKTDEDNLKTKYKILEELIDKEVYITLKMDGSSLTIIKKDNEIIVCSRNLVIEEGHIMYQYLIQDKLIEKLKTYEGNIALQGEFCGPKVNNNRMELKKYKWYIFNIKDLNTDKFFGLKELQDFTNKYEFDMVPLLDTLILDNTYNVNKFQEYSNNVTYTTPMNRKVPAEGIVVRPIEPIWSKYLEKYISFKIINQKYKD